MLGAGGLGRGLDSLAKSVLKNLSKRIDDESTQQQICNFLNRADSAQLRSYASMAGMDLPAGAADRIASVATKVTPGGIKKGVKWSKRAIKAATVMRKTAKVIGKYRHLIVLAAILGWIKSAVLRPIKISKKAAAKAAAAAAKAAVETAKAAATSAAAGGVVAASASVGSIDAAAAAMRGASDASATEATTAVADADAEAEAEAI